MGASYSELPRMILYTSCLLERVRRLKVLVIHVFRTSSLRLLVDDHHWEPLKKPCKSTRTPERMRL